MIRFDCDYITGAHPKVLERLVATNAEACPGYSEDEHCANAARMIRKLCNAPDAAVHFLVGGTQSNMTVISAALRPHQGVIATQIGHISAHETGAIEATGHEVLTVPHHNGKLLPEQITEMCRAHYADPAFEHLTQPGMVYFSQPTELGTVYTKAELEAIRKAADEYHLPVFVDGARLACALAVSDATLEDMARLCDVFYLGGTKLGLLFGEAVVITNDAIKRDFRYLIKQKGGMLAKGRLLGVQFEAILEDNLYFEIGKKEVEQGLRLQKAFLDKGWPLLLQSQTNQQFPILPNNIISKLNRKYTSCFWQTVDEGHTAVRFCTAWSTRDEDVTALINDIQDL